MATGATGAFAVIELDGVSANSRTLESLHERDLQAHQLRFYLARQENSFRGWLLSRDPYYLERLAAHNQNMLWAVGEIREGSTNNVINEKLTEIEQASAAWHKDAVGGPRRLSRSEASSMPPCISSLPTPSLTS